MSGAHEKPNDGTGASVDWCTPPWILSPLGRFDLDPCACAGQVNKTAKRMISIEQDGFDRAWIGRVWLNPPYGTMMPRWVRKLADHGNGVALIFARTETAVWQDDVLARADAILFLRGRVGFVRSDGSAVGSATAASALVAYGVLNARALEECGLPGQLILRRGKIAL